MWIYFLLHISPTTQNSNMTHQIKNWHMKIKMHNYGFWEFVVSKYRSVSIRKGKSKLYLFDFLPWKKKLNLAVVWKITTQKQILYHTVLKDQTYHKLHLKTAVWAWMHELSTFLDTHKPSY